MKAWRSAQVKEEYVKIDRDVPVFVRHELLI